MKKKLLLILSLTASVYAQSATGGTANIQSQPAMGSSANMQPQSGMKPQAGTFQWYTSLDDASKVSSQQRKPMVLYFTGSDWCGWCKKMDQEVFASQDFMNAVSGKYIFVKLDFPINQKLSENEMRQNAQLKQKYGVTGYPTLVLVDPDGNFVGETGYRSGGGKAYAEWLDQFFAK